MRKACLDQSRDVVVQIGLDGRESLQPHRSWVSVRHPDVTASLQPRALCVLNGKSRIQASGLEIFGLLAA